MQHTREYLEAKITTDYAEYKIWDGKVTRSGGYDSLSLRQRAKFEGYVNKSLEQYMVLDLEAIPVAA